MAEFKPASISDLNLKNKVIVLTGGASGIGAATVRLLHLAGAHVVFGDISSIAGSSIETSLKRNTGSVSDSYGTATFVRGDVSSYADTYALFRKAYDLHGHIDHAIASAGILERGKWFDPNLTITSVARPDNEAHKVLETNLMGVCNFARIAAVFLRQDRTNKESETGSATGEPSDANSWDKSITFIASVASIRESAGLYMYQTSKTALLGLLRSMRTVIYNRDRIRTNIICPGMTESAMTTGFIGRFRKEGLSTQTSEDAARIIVGVVAQREAALDYSQTTSAAQKTEIESKEILNGKAFYVEGGRAWEFEQSLWDAMPDWLGGDATEMLRRNAEFVASGALLKKD